MNLKVVVILLFFFSCTSKNTLNRQAFFHKEKGVEYLSHKKYTAAIDELTKAITIKKDYDTAYLNLGIAYLAVNECEKARLALGEATKYNPGVVEWETALVAAYICLGEYDEAKKRLDAININKESEIVYSTFALYYMNTEDYGRALYNLTRVAELNPLNSGNFAQRALLYYYNEEYENALKDIHKAIGLDSTNQEYLNLQLMITQEINNEL